MRDAEHLAVLEQLAAQDAKIDQQREHLIQLATHRSGATTTANGAVITAPSTGRDAQIARFDASLLEDRLLHYLEARTGVTRDQIKDGQKVYDDGSLTDPWVVTAKDGRQWLVTLDARGSGGIVSELFSTKTSPSPPADG